MITHVFPPSYSTVAEKLQKWTQRFVHSTDESISNDLILFYGLATKKYLDHRSAYHLFRLVLSIHLMQKKLLNAITSFPHGRHLEIRWMPTSLLFPFVRKPVLGCLIGFNVIDRYEVFDEENIILALRKLSPELRLVKDSSYTHSSQYKNIKIFYFEVEKQDASPFSLQEQNLLKQNFEEKVKNSIQTLSPTIFMMSNEEEIYKNILILSEEIKSLTDIPQVYITFDRQNGQEVIFRISLVYLAPSHSFSLKNQFPENMFVSERVLIVRHLENYPLEAHLFSLHLPRDPTLLRSDGSLDFYAARHKVASILQAAIGEFRDYNGGIILKQQELLQGFKERFSEVARHNPELLENFFYGLAPLENQAVLQPEILAELFTHFQTQRKEKLPQDTPYALRSYQNAHRTFFMVHGLNTHLKKMVSRLLQNHLFKTEEIAYTIVETPEGIFFNCVFQQENSSEKKRFLLALQKALDGWHLERKNQQTLRIAFEFNVISLDPRIGGEAISGDVLKFLFEGLTRFNSQGHIENAIAESVEISPNGKEYIFKLRPCLWNDGSPLSAYDFEYAWKKILSPNFKTAFAYFFYFIKNAKEAKEDKVCLDSVGIHVIDERTLKVELEHPTSYFLQVVANSLYSPVHRLMDQQYPQWPYQAESNYPCNGPFQLKVNQPTQGYHLIKNPFYWDAAHIALNQIILNRMNTAKAIQAFQKKEIDWVGNPFGTYHSFLSKEGQITSFSNPMVCLLIFNTATFPFNNHKLRKAFAYAVQRAKIVAESPLSFKPAFSPLNPHFCENRPALFPDDDPGKAMQLFEEALHELAIDRKSLGATINLLSCDKGSAKYASSCLQQQIHECFGIHCKMDLLPWNELFPKITKGFYQIGFMCWVSWMDDPIYTLNAFKSSEQDLNCIKWDHAEYGNLLDQAKQELNPFQRSIQLLQAEKILGQEMPIIPLFYQAPQALIRKELEVSDKNPCGAYNIARSFFKKEKSNGSDM